MNVVFAPHADDELIGCYEVLNCAEQCKVIFPTTKMSKKRLHEASQLKDFLITVTSYQDIKSIDEIISEIRVDNPDTTFYFPDPYWELHPEHKQLGSVGYILWKNLGLDIIFYSTNMNTPYLHELNEYDKTKKENLLNAVYPSQSDLWKYEKKYIFFEGRIKYLR